MFFYLVRYRNPGAVGPGGPGMGMGGQDKQASALSAAFGMIDSAAQV